MQHLIDWISNTAVHFVDSMGVVGIFIGMVLESACIPIPSEVILLSGGGAAAHGSMTYLGVVLAGVLGNMFGSVIAYYAGRIGGRKFLERYGRYVLFKNSHLEQSQRWFDRFGESTVFFTRNLPFIRTFISFPAGIAKMNFKKFIGYTALGCIPWNMALAYAGLKLGQHSGLIEHTLHQIGYVIAGVLCILLVFWLIRTKRKAVA